MPAKSVSALLDRSTVSGLIQIEGVQFVMPQTIAESIPFGADKERVEFDFEPELTDNVSPFGVLEFFPRKRTKTAGSLAPLRFPEEVTF